MSLSRTALEIEAEPALSEGVLLTNKKVHSHLGDNKGLLYCVEGVTMSRAKSETWKDNGSNATVLVGKTVLSGEQKGKDRWSE
jgi:hypothetical protein